MTNLQVAIKLLKAGLRPIPIKANCKKPPLVSWEQFQQRAPTTAEVTQWWTQWPNANVAMLTGTPGGIDVIDFDPGHAVFPPAGSEFPEQFVVQTPRGGKHVYFKATSGATCSTSQLAEHIDVRAEGGFVLVPPSVVDGKSYLLVCGAFKDVPECPSWLAERLIGTIKKPKEKVNEGSRNNRCTREAGRLRQLGHSEREIEIAVLKYNIEKCDPPLDADEIHTIAQSVARYKPADVILTTSNGDALPIATTRTDLGNARRFAIGAKDELRYCSTQGKWLAWDSKRWQPDDGNAALSVAKEVMKRYLHEAINSEQEEAIKHAFASTTSNKIRASVDLGRSEPELAIKIDRLDTNRWLFNCHNGTLDLKSGELRPHSREDLLTMMSNVTYDKDATCPRWEAFLSEVLTPEVAAYLQVFCGYVLTGDVREQIFPIFYGVGANGKSTFLDTVLRLMGDYAGKAPPNFLVVRKTDEHPTEIADLLGKRLTYASETEQGGSLRVQRVKELTGDLTLKGRFMHRDFFEFQRTNKIILITNNKPAVKETSHAIWRRLHLIHFDRVIANNKQDHGLLDRLLQETSGILNWMLAGCVQWQQRGLQPTSSITAETEEYKQDEDPLREFLERCCVLAGNCTREDLYMAYENFSSERHNKFPLSRRRLFDEVRRIAGVIEDRLKGERVFTGIALNGQQSQMGDIV